MRRLSEEASELLKKELPKYRLLVVLVVLAALLRLPSFDGISTYTYVERDRDIAVTRQMREGTWPELGPKSVLGSYRFGPAYYYLIYPFAALLDFAPYSIAVASMFFSLATLVAVFFTALRWWKSPGPAYLAATVMAVSALDIQFAKYASNPNLLPLFAIGFFSCVEYLMRPAANGRRRQWAALTAGACYGVAAQLHAVPLVAMPVAVIMLVVVGNLRPKAGEWLAMAAGAAAVSLPYLSYELSHGFSNMAGLFGIATSPAEYGDLFSRWTEYFTFWFSLWISLHHLFSVVHAAGPRIMVPIVATMALALPVWSHDRRHPRPAGKPAAWPPSVLRSVLAWLLAPSLLLLLPFGKVSQLFIYYFTIFTPLAFLLMGYGLHWAWRKGWRATFWFCLCAYVLWQVEQIWIYAWTVA